MHVARGHHAPGGGNAHDRLGEILLGESHRIEHCAAGGAAWAVEQEGGMLAGDGFLGSLGGGDFLAAHAGNLPATAAARKQEWVPRNPELDGP